MTQIVLLVPSVLCFSLSTVPAFAPHWNRLVGIGLAALAAALFVGARGL